MSAPIDHEALEAFGKAISEADWIKLRLDHPPGLAETDIFLAYQKKLLATTAVNRVTFYEKSRRTGVTWAAAYDAVITASKARSAGGMNVFYMGYNLEMAREFIDVCAMWAKNLQEALGQSDFPVHESLFEDAKGNKDVKAFSIDFVSGFSIKALPSRPRSLRGMQGYVIIDEAAFHDDLQELLKAAMALLIWGGKVLVISTHDGEMNPFNQVINDIRTGRKKYALLRTDFDEALLDGLYERVCQRTGERWTAEGEAAWRASIISDYGDAADEELYVVPSEGSGTAILPSVLDKAARDIPVLRWSEPAAFAGMPEEYRRARAGAFIEEIRPHLGRLDRKALTFAGWDFALVADLSVFWPVQLGKGGPAENPLVRRTPFVVELRNIPYPQQKQVLWWLIEQINLAVLEMDATGNGAPLAQETAMRYGDDRVQQVKINVGWYRDTMPLLKEALEVAGFELPADPEIHSDFRALKRIDGVIQVPKTRNTVKGDGAKAGKPRHGDAAIAAALAEHASLTPIMEYGYVTAGRADESPMPYSDDDEPSGRSLW